MVSRTHSPRLRHAKRTVLNSRMSIIGECCAVPTYEDRKDGNCRSRHGEALVEPQPHFGRFDQSVDEYVADTPPIDITAPSSKLRRMVAALLFGHDSRSRSTRAMMGDVGTLNGECRSHQKLRHPSTETSPTAPPPPAPGPGCRIAWLVHSMGNCSKMLAWQHDEGATDGP